MRSPPENLTLGTFNLLNFAAPPAATYQPQQIYRAKDWEKKCAWIVRQLKRMEAEIVGFQEVFDPAALKLLVQQAGYAHFAVVDQPRESRSGLYDRPVVAIAAKYPFQSIEPLAIKSLSEYLPADFPVPDDFAFSRTALLAEFAWAGQPSLHVLVLHLKSPRALLSAAEQQPYVHWFGGQQDDNWMPLHWPKGTQTEVGSCLSAWQRAAEALVVNAAAKQSAESGAALMVLGDLNDHLHSASGQALQIGQAEFTQQGVQTPAHQGQVKRELAEIGLHNAAELAATSSEYPTYFHHGKPLYLDYVLLNNRAKKQWQAVEHRVLNRHLGRNRNGSIRKSDHAQVTVKFQLAPV